MNDKGFASRMTDWPWTAGRHAETHEDENAEKSSLDIDVDEIFVLMSCWARSRSLLMPICDHKVDSISLGQLMLMISATYGGGKTVNRLRRAQRRQRRVVTLMPFLCCEFHLATLRCERRKINLCSVYVIDESLPTSI